MKYTLRTHVDAAASRVEEEWGSLTWLAGKAHGNCDEMSVARVVIKAGRANPRHAHANCAEVLYLLQGRLEHTAGEEKVVLNAGDTLVVPAEVMHNALNVGADDADMIVCYSAGERQFRRES